MIQFKQEVAQKDPNNEILSQDLALVTAMASRIDLETNNRSYGYFQKDDDTQEMLHYAEKSQVNTSNLINCGIYIFSTRIFDEFGLTKQDDEQ